MSKIKGCFADLVRRIGKKLESRNINIQEFRTYMVTLFAPGHFINNIEDIVEIFQAISRHRLWDFSDYVNLEQISSDFGGGDPELDEWMTEYKTKLTGFYATTKIVEYIDACDSNIELAEADDSLQQDIARYDKKYCKTLTMKLQSRVTQLCLDYIDQLWHSIANHFVLPSLSFLLEKIHKGCIEVILVIPIKTAMKILESSHDSIPFFEQNNIIKVMIEDKIIYQGGSMRRTSMVSYLRLLLVP